MEVRWHAAFCFNMAGRNYPLLYIDVVAWVSWHVCLMCPIVAFSELEVCDCNSSLCLSWSLLVACNSDRTC